jgi:uncharacterized RDD family membrane protein YckC
MADDVAGSPGAGPTSAPPPPPPMPPAAPPSYPAPPAGGYPPPQVQFPPPGSFAPPGGPYAQWGTRFGGYLIDFVIFLVVQLALGALLHKSNTLVLRMRMTSNGVVHHNRFSLLAVLITAVLYVIYSTIFCGGRRGQTVGMMAVGVRAVRADTLDVLGYGKAFGRAVLEQIFRPTVILWLLDGLFPLWDSRRQTLHDKAAGTVVIRARNAG